jgi:hypothetical protein
VLEVLDTVTKSVPFTVIGKDADKNYVYGWASIAMTSDGRPVIDLQGDVIDVYDLEDTAAEFVKQYRQGGEMHEGSAPSELIASTVFTPELMEAIGITPGKLPYGWLLGFEVPPSTFAKVKKGSLLMFSIEGEAERVPIRSAA